MATVKNSSLLLPCSMGHLLEKHNQEMLLAVKMLDLDCT